jgi:hypothetical protein
MRNSFALIAAAVVASLTSAPEAQNQDPIPVVSSIESSYAWAPNCAEQPAEGLGFLSVSGDWQLVGFREDGGVGDSYQLAMAVSRRSFDRAGN